MRSCDWIDLVGFVSIVVLTGFIIVALSHLA